jgi:membrane protein DedA with SNARE-associated domain
MCVAAGWKPGRRAVQDPASVFAKPSMYDQWPYLGVLGVLLACSLGLPLPEDVPLLTGGFLCHRGLASVYFMIPVGMLGVLAGDFMLFALGKRFGHRIVKHRFFRRLVNPSRLLAAERLFASHGLKIIFAARFLPGLRPMFFVSAGVLGVPFWQFALVNGAAACISVPTLVLLGRFFGQNLESLEHNVRAASAIIGAILAALLAAAIYFHTRQQKLMAEAGVTEVDADTLVQMPPTAREPRSKPTAKRSEQPEPSKEPQSPQEAPRPQR